MSESHVLFLWELLWVACPSESQRSMGISSFSGTTSQNLCVLSHRSGQFCWRTLLQNVSKNKTHLETPLEAGNVMNLFFTKQVQVSWCSFELLWGMLLILVLFCFLCSAVCSFIALVQSNDWSQVFHSSYWWTSSLEACNYLTNLGLPKIRIIIFIHKCFCIGVKKGLFILWKILSRREGWNLI